MRPDLSVNAVVTMITQRRLAIENERLCIWLEIRVYAYPTNAAPRELAASYHGRPHPVSKACLPISTTQAFQFDQFAPAPEDPNQKVAAAADHILC